MVTGPTYHYVPGDVTAEELHAGHPEWDDVPTTGAPDTRGWFRRLVDWVKRRL